MKTCIKCEEPKDKEAFHKKKGGRENTCKACRYERERKAKTEEPPRPIMGAAMVGGFYDFLVKRTHCK